MRTPAERLKTGILVTLIAGLIWALAEGQSLRTQRTVAEIEFEVLSNGTWSTRLVEGQSWRGRVELVLEGPVASLDSLDAALREPLVFSPGMDGLPRASGEHILDLREALRAHPEFRSRGVSVVSADPATVRVRVQELATVSVPIRIEAPAAALDGPAELVGQSEASVRLPADLVSGLGEGAAWMVAEVSAEDLASLQEGVRSVLRVRLVPGPGVPEGAVFSIEPAQVDVRLTVRSKTETILVPTVPVDLRLPVGELGRWDVTISAEDQSLRDVEITGPSELIERIRSNSLAVRAYVRLSYEELEAGVSSKRAEFSGYPTALTFSAEDLDVALSITKREPGPGDGADSSGSP